MFALWLMGAVVTASSVPMGTFNGAHALGLLLMVTITVLWWRQDVAAWHRVDGAEVAREARRVTAADARWDAVAAQMHEQDGAV